MGKIILIAMIVLGCMAYVRLDKEICRLNAQLNTIQIQTSTPISIEHKTPNIKLLEKRK